MSMKMLSKKKKKKISSKSTIEKQKQEEIIENIQSHQKIKRYLHQPT